MNVSARSQADHFIYFPGNYRWSAGMLGALSSAPYGGSGYMRYAFDDEDKAYDNRR
jgi:hypothetical protein